MSERRWPCGTPGCGRTATLLLTLETLTDHPFEAPRLACLCDRCGGDPAGDGLFAAARGLLGSATPRNGP